jgi:hypothetical protein
MKFPNFFLCLRVIFALLDPDTDPLTWLNLDQIRIRNTAFKTDIFYGGTFSLLRLHMRTVHSRPDFQLTNQGQPCGTLRTQKEENPVMDNYFVSGSMLSLNCVIVNYIVKRYNSSMTLSIFPSS